jgi:hypothetical protein
VDCGQRAGSDYHVCTEADDMNNEQVRMLLEVIRMLIELIREVT